MSGNELAQSPETTFTALLMAAAELPGVRIDRTAYLQSALKRFCSEDEIRRAVAESPAAAGIPREFLDRAANESINSEGLRTSALSAVTGLPGLFLLPAAVPADAAQYLGHMLRIAQMLAYLYSWPDLFDDDLDDAAKGVLTLLVGVMVDTAAAGAAVEKVAGLLAEDPSRQTLTKALVYPVVARVAGCLGLEMAKQTFARSVSKAVPILGAVVSGGFTLATYLPMAQRLKKHLAGLELSNPEHRVVNADFAEAPPADPV
ncbi:hypothetical protein Q0Z83_008100 [Actinoplanes sichuanensis]|uniref:EcsC family protein n=1 Tax=Actinoplanes sichuanensis TaxID=512349 RepID=A0ABW4AF47_9ACTN|nr:hypothetical protein [Actinoplanes sichuanensis]BEL02619.1 hypothetical protein Q0Z83_008100 [Actinoplanes sichuanensis]